MDELAPHTLTLSPLLFVRVLFRTVLRLHVVDAVDELPLRVFGALFRVVFGQEFGGAFGKGLVNLARAPAGFVVRQRSRVASNFRSDETLERYLARHGVVGIAGIDTRALVQRIRERGAMKNPQSSADKDSNRQLWEREWFDYAVEQVPQLQLEAMNQRRIDLRSGAADVKGRSDIIYLNGDDPNLDPEKRRVQTPRVFYRREPESSPLIVAMP